MIKMVAFDLDNTLYDYDICHKKAMEKLEIAVFQKYGIPRAQFYDTFKEAKKIIKRRLGETGASHNRLLYIQTFLELIKEPPVNGALELYNIYWDTVLEHMTLFPYVNPLFEKLKQNKIKIAILTDLTAHIQHRKIIKLGLEKKLDYLVTSEEAGQEKPSAKMFHLLLQKTGYTFKEIVVLGDDWEKDIEGAQKIGIYSILFTKDRAYDMDDICLRYIYGQNVEK